MSTTNNTSFAVGILPSVLLDSFPAKYENLCNFAAQTAEPESKKAAKQDDNKNPKA